MFHNWSFHCSTSLATLPLFLSHSLFPLLSLLFFTHLTFLTQIFSRELNVAPTRAYHNLSSFPVGFPIPHFQISLPPASGKGRHPLLRASFISALVPHPPLFSLQISAEFQRGGINKKSQMLFLVRREFFMPSLLSFGQLR